MAPTIMRHGTEDVVLEMLKVRSVGSGRLVVPLPGIFTIWTCPKTCNFQLSLSQQRAWALRRDRVSAPTACAGAFTETIGATRRSMLTVTLTDRNARCHKVFYEI